VDLGDGDVEIRAEAFGDVGHGGRDVEVKRRPEPRERHPLSQGFEVVHRFDRLDLDDCLDLAPLLRGEDHVGIDGGGAGAYRGVLLGSRVDSRIETTAKLCMEEADDAVVLQLLADRPDEDGAHEIATIAWKGSKQRPDLGR
jgi:hypothetical protein